MAQAYEQGDGKTVGKAMREQVTNALSALPSGGLAGGIVKNTKMADKFLGIKSTIDKIEKSVNGSEVDQLTKNGIKFYPDKLIATGKALMVRFFS